MRARAVRGIDPRESLRKAGQRIIRTRLQELLELAPGALGSGEARALHDLRIAAKRLRYTLELTDFCYGDDARRAARGAREIQDLAGAIHDYDMLLARIAAYSTAYIGERGQALARASGARDDAPLRPERADRATCAALGALAIECRSQRERLLAQLRARFDGDRQAQLQRKLLAALGARQRPGRERA